MSHLVVSRRGRRGRHVRVVVAVVWVIEVVVWVIVRVGCTLWSWVIMVVWVWGYVGCRRSWVVVVEWVWGYVGYRRRDLNSNLPHARLPHAHNPCRPIEHLDPSYRPPNARRNPFASYPVLTSPLIPLYRF